MPTYGMAQTPAITHGTTDPTLLITKLSPSGQLNNARESYLRFNLATVTGTVSSATLRVYGKVDLTTVPSVPVGDVGSGQYHLERICAHLEQQARFRCRAGYQHRHQYSVCLYHLGCDQLCASRAGGIAQQVSFARKSLTAHDPRVFWNSKEFGSNPPELLIEAAENLASKTKSTCIRCSRQMLHAKLYPRISQSFQGQQQDHVQHSALQGNTELSVFDIQGRRVAVLVNGYPPPASICTAVLTTSRCERHLPG